MTDNIEKNKFSNRLNAALDKENFPPKNKGRAQILAEMMGLTKAGIGKWLNGLSSPPEKTYKILAKKLSVNELWLKTGQGDMLTEAQIIESSENLEYEKDVPLFKLENLNKPIKMIRCTVPLQGKGLAFHLKTNAMEPRFPLNSVIIIDTEKSVKHGDFVLVEHINFPIPIFRQILIFAHKKILLAHNPQFEKLSLTNESKIIGVMIQAIISFC